MDQLSAVKPDLSCHQFPLHFKDISETCKSRAGWKHAMTACVNVAVM